MFRPQTRQLLGIVPQIMFRPQTRQLLGRVPQIMFRPQTRQLLGRVPQIMFRPQTRQLLGRVPQIMFRPQTRQLLGRVPQIMFRPQTTLAIFIVTNWRSSTNIFKYIQIYSKKYLFKWTIHFSAVSGLSGGEQSHGWDAYRDPNPNPDTFLVVTVATNAPPTAQHAVLSCKQSPNATKENSALRLLSSSFGACVPGNDKHKLRQLNDHNLLDRKHARTTCGTRRSSNKQET